MEQISSAVVAIVIGVGVTMIYFFGTNFLLDTLLQDTRSATGEFISREKQRESIRPWLFIAPALLLLGLYLVYPAIQTHILSFHGQYGREFVG